MFDARIILECLKRYPNEIPKDKDQYEKQGKAWRIGQRRMVHYCSYSGIELDQLLERLYSEGQGPKQAVEVSI